MNRNWRLILQKDTSAAYGLAVDEMAALSVSRNNSPPILHLYNFLPCVVLGRYQSAEEAVDIEQCRENGLEINRRHTGGGTVLMGPGQLALGFSIPRNYPGVGPGINEIFRSLGGVLCKALAKLGLKARFRPKNDIEINGKKIAGLSASLEEREVAFFHASLLLDFDFKLMLKVLKLPLKKLKGKGISCFTRRMTTIRAEKRRKLDLPHFQSLVRKAFEEHFGISFRIDTFSQWEIDYLDLLLRHRYTNPEWIYTRRHPGVGVGFASAKTRGGLVEVGVTLSGGVIEAAYLSGDFLSTSKEVNRIESALRYCAAYKTRIEKKLRPVMREGTIFKVNRDAIVKLILKAAENARIAREKALKKAQKLRKAEEERLKRESRAMRAAFKAATSAQTVETGQRSQATEKAKPAAKKAKSAIKEAMSPKKAKTAPKKAKPAVKKTKPATKKAKPAAKSTRKKPAAVRKAARAAKGKASHKKTTAKRKAKGRKR